MKTNLFSARFALVTVFVLFCLLVRMVTGTTTHEGCKRCHSIHQGPHGNRTSKKEQKPSLVFARLWGRGRCEHDQRMHYEHVCMRVWLYACMYVAVMHYSFPFPHFIFRSDCYTDVLDSEDEIKVHSWLMSLNTYTTWLFTSERTYD